MLGTPVSGPDEIEGGRPASGQKGNPPMRITLSEHGTCFELYFQPETPEETLQLLRMATNSKPNEVEVAAYYAGRTLDASVRIGAYHNKRTSIRNTERRER